MESRNFSEGERLRDFDYSVRVNLSNSSLCGDRQHSVVLKLRLEKTDGSERQVVLELDNKQIALLLKEFRHIHQELQKY